MFKNKKFRIIVLAFCVVLVLMTVACSSDEAFEDISGSAAASGVEDTGLPELKIISSTEGKEWVVVDTTYGTFRYSVAFADIMSVETVNQNNAAQLKFFAQIDGSNVLIYTIHYNANIGTPCGRLSLDDNHKDIPVFVEFEHISGSIHADWLSTYYAVEETFNDVIGSMSENSGFNAEG